MANSICEACRRIDFGKALESPPTDEGFVDLNADVNRLAEVSGINCSLCRLLASTLLSCEDFLDDPGHEARAAKMPYRLSTFSFLRHCPWASKYVEGAKDCHILLAPRGLSYYRPSDFSDWARNSEDGYIVCLPKRREAGLLVPQLISDTFDRYKAKLWLRNCKVTHGTACNGYYEAIPGLKVIDCETLRIVQIQHGALWVALSYVWGHDQSEISTRDAQHGTIPRIISRTIQHAIEITKDLGYKYLWVDRYCINQQDEEEKQGFITKMDMIYSGADLTIVAAAGHDEHFGLPGIGTTQRKKQKVVELDHCTILSTGPDPIQETKRSRWWTRGWTFQEAVFSRRRLIFTEHQSYFECDQASRMEALGGLELFIDQYEALKGLDLLNDHNERLEGLRLLGYQYEPQSAERIGPSLIAWLLSDSHGSSPRWPGLNREVLVRIGQFSATVEYYSERNLTFDTDSLNAFAGISRYLQNCSPPLAHIFGIPFMPSLISIDGCDRTEKHLFYFLCWFHYEEATPHRRQDFPSWTWAGWAGRVGWMTDFIPSDWEESLGQNMTSIQFEVDGHLIPQEAYLNVFDPAGCYRTEVDVILCFKARVVPPSTFSWNTYVENRDEPELWNAYLDERVRLDYADLITNKETQEPNKCLATGAKDHTEQGSSDTQSQESNQVQTPDPNDWGTWTVGRLKLWDQSLPPDCGPEAFMENLQKGRWDCLLLGDYVDKTGFRCRRFLLVIERLDNELARRVGCVVVNKDPYLDKMSELFDDSQLSWKSVRVI